MLSCNQFYSKCEKKPGGGGGWQKTGKTTKMIFYDLVACAPYKDALEFSMCLI